MEELFSKYIIERWWIPILLTLFIGIAFVVAHFVAWNMYWAAPTLVLFIIATLCLLVLSIIHFYRKRWSAAIASLFFSIGCIACVLTYFSLLYILLA